MVKMKLGLLFLKKEKNKFILHNFEIENEKKVENSTVEFIDYKKSDKYLILLFDMENKVIIYGVELVVKADCLHIQSLDSTGEYREGNDLVKYLLIALLKYFNLSEISLFSRYQPYFLFNIRKKKFSADDLCEFWLKIMRIFQCINNFSYSIYKNKFTNKIILFSDRPEMKIAKLVAFEKKNYADKIIYFGNKGDFTVLLKNNKDYQQGNILTVKRKESRKNTLFCKDHEDINRILNKFIENFKIFSGDSSFLKKYSFCPKKSLFTASEEILIKYSSKISTFSLNFSSVKL